ncbi:MAG TPA: methyltransferase, partial [Cellulomonadaceae bacterium]|nr:methyltransferase [Cellulomonadaceae bacterium]
MHPHEDVVVARYLVTAQFGLIGLLVLIPGGGGWGVPVALQVACAVLVVAGVGIMGLGATSLGRGLTATPLPNQHAELRTGGLYRYVRHPIYTGLLLAATAFAVASGSVERLVVLVLLIALLQGKA